MNMKQMKDLLALFSQHGLTRLEVSEGEMKILVAREAPAAPYLSPEPPGTFPPAMAPGFSAFHSAAVPSSPLPSGASGSTGVPSAPEDPGPDFNRLHEVKSPMVGVFYRAPEPGGEPFVQVGDSVAKGAVLCIVEAMKLNNEITADVQGEVVDVCVQDGDVVEYGQTLFKLFQPRS